MDTDPLGEAADAQSPIRLSEMSEAENVDQLVAAISSKTGSELVIDGADVKLLGALNAQALIVAAKTWERDGVQFRIVSPSPAMSGDLELLGFKDALASNIVEEGAA